MNLGTSTTHYDESCNFNNLLIDLQELVHIFRQAIDELARQSGDARLDGSPHREDHPNPVPSAYAKASQDI